MHPFSRSIPKVEKCRTKASCCTSIWFVSLQVNLARMGRTNKDIYERREEPSRIKDVPSVCRRAAHRPSKKWRVCCLWTSFPTVACTWAHDRAKRGTRSFFFCTNWLAFRICWFTTNLARDESAYKGVKLSKHKFFSFTRLKPNTVFEGNKCRTISTNLY